MFLVALLCCYRICVAGCARTGFVSEWYPADGLIHMGHDGDGYDPQPTARRPEVSIRLQQLLTIWEGVEVLGVPLRSPCVEPNQARAEVLLIIVFSWLMQHAR